MGLKKINFIKYLTFIVLLIASNALSAQDHDVDLDAIQNGLTNIEKSFKDISKQFDDKKIPTDSLKGVNHVLVVYRDSLFDKSTVLNKELNDANLDLTKLGPAPGEGDPVEPENVTNKRKDLNSKITKVSGLVSSTSVLIDDIGELLNKINDARSSNFLAGIKDRSTSPFSPTLWKEANKELKGVFKSIDDYYSKFWPSFWKDDKRVFNILIILISFLLAIAVFIVPHTAFGKKIDSVFKLPSKFPSIATRLQIISNPLKKALVVFIASCLLYLGGIESRLITSSDGKEFAYHLITNLAIFVFIWYLAKNIFLPNHVVLGNVACAPGKEKQNRYLFVGMILVFLLNQILEIGLKVVGTEMSLFFAQTIISTSIFSFMLFLFFSFKRWKFMGKEIADVKMGNSSDNGKDVVEDKNKQKRRSLAFELVHYLGRAMALILLVLILLEYLSLASFLFQRIVLIVLFFILFRTVKTLAKYAISELNIVKSLIINSSKNNSDSEKLETNEASVYYWLNLSLNIVLFIFFTPLFLNVLGMDWVDINNLMDLLSQGIKVGAITISFKNIFYGIVVFLAVYLSIKWSASMINKQLIAHSNMDSGLRNSIITILNYVGFIIAVIASFPIFGFSFSNITIVAGALSVGIGFGLQNIVVDYLAGFILLIERPIKVGDWIVVSAGEGYVKDINRRFTVIQTFDRAMIIVPNSELISSPVINWFYKNIKGRLVITVGVDYNSDPDKVKELLLKCANDHPSIVLSPKPSVILAGYGDHSIDFELRGFVKNVDNGYDVKSELRFSIIERFKEAGIVMPVSQRGIQIKKVDDGLIDNKITKVDPPKKKPVKKSVKKPIHKKDTNDAGPPKTAKK